MIDDADDPHLPESLLQVFGNFISDGTPHSLGPHGHFRVSSFIDLLAAVHETTALDILSQFLAEFVEEKVNLDTIDFIAAPKRGNVLLGNAVAKSLNKPTIFARDEVLFGKWFEGIAHGNQRVILVDDVASDGHLLKQAINSLRQAGISTLAVVALIARKEGAPNKIIQSLQVPFLAKYTFLDSDLLEIRDAFRRGSGKKSGGEAFKLKNVAFEFSSDNNLPADLIPKS